MLSLLMLLNFNLFQPISNPPIEIHKIRKQYLSKGIKTITFLIPNSNYNVATNSSVAINYNHAVLIFRTCYPNLSRFTRTFPVYRTYAYTAPVTCRSGYPLPESGGPMPRAAAQIDAEKCAWNNACSRTAPVRSAPRPSHPLRRRRASCGEEGWGGCLRGRVKREAPMKKRVCERRI